MKKLYKIPHYFLAILALQLFVPNSFAQFADSFKGCIFSQPIQRVDCSPRIKGLPRIETFLGTANFSTREEAEKRMEELYKNLYSLEQKITTEINKAGVYPRSGGFSGTILNFNGQPVQRAADWNSSYHTVRMDNNFGDFDGQVDCSRLLNAALLKDGASDIYLESSFNREIPYDITLKKLRDNYNKFIPSFSVDTGEKRRSDPKYARWFFPNQSIFIDSDHFVNVWGNEFQRELGSFWSTNNPPQVDPTWIFILRSLESHGVNNRSDLYRFQYGLLQTCQHYELKQIQDFYAESIKRVRVIKQERAARDQKCDPLMSYAKSNLTLSDVLIDDTAVKREINQGKANTISTLNIPKLLKYIIHSVNGATARFASGELTSAHYDALMDARVASDVLYCSFKFQSDETMIQKLDSYIYSLTHSTVTTDISPNSCDCSTSTYSGCKDYASYQAGIATRVQKTDAVYSKLITPEKQPSDYIAGIERRRDIPFKSMFTKMGDEFLSHATMTYITMLYTYGIVDFKPLVQSQKTGTNVKLEKQMVDQYYNYQGGMGGGGQTYVNRGKKVRGLSEESFRALVVPLGTCGSVSDTSDMCQKLLEISQRYMIKGLVEVDKFIESGEKEPVLNCGMGANGTDKSEWENLIFTHFSPTKIKNRIEAMGNGLLAPVNSCSGQTGGSIKSKLVEAMGLAINDIIQNDILTQDFENNPELFKRYVRFLPFLYTETFLSNFQVEPAQPIPFTPECYPELNTHYGGGAGTIPRTRYQSFTVTPIQVPRCGELKNDLHKIIKNIPMGIINPREYFIGVDWSMTFAKIDQSFFNFFRNLKEIYITGEQRHLASMPPSIAMGMALGTSMQQADATLTGSETEWAQLLSDEDKDLVTHLKLLFATIKKHPKGLPYESYFLRKFPQKAPQICALYDKVEFDEGAKVLIEKSMKKWYSFWKWASIIVTAIAIVVVPFGGVALAGVAFTKFMVGATIATYLGTSVMALWKGDFTAQTMFEKELKASDYMSTCIAQMHKMSDQLDSGGDVGYTQDKMNAACGESFNNLQMAKEYSDKLSGVITDWAIETAFYAFYIAGSVHHLKHLTHHIHDAEKALKAAKATGVAEDILKAEQHLKHAQSMYPSSFEGMGETFAKTMNGPLKTLEGVAEGANKLTKAQKLGRFAKSVYKSSVQVGRNYLDNLIQANLGIVRGNAKKTLKNLKGDYSYLGSKGFKGYYYSAAWMKGKTKYAKYFFMAAPQGLLAHLLFDEQVTDYLSNRIKNGSLNERDIETIEFENNDLETWYDNAVKVVEDIESVEGDAGIVLALGRKMKEYEYTLEGLSEAELAEVNNKLKEANENLNGGH